MADIKYCAQQSQKKGEQKSKLWARRNKKRKNDDDKERGCGEFRKSAAAVHLDVNLAIKLTGAAFGARARAAGGGCAHTCCTYISMRSSPGPGIYYI